MATNAYATVPETNRDVVASFTRYADAQAAVDHLSDRGFPVEDVRIVGHDLSSVEIVTGRLTKGRAALAGAGSGAWFGLFVGLLLGIFTSGPVWLAVLLTSLVLGAVWGAALGFVAHWSTRGRRDFASTQRLVADRYDVLADADRVAEARRLLQSRV